MLYKHFQKANKEWPSILGVAGGIKFPSGRTACHETGFGNWNIRSLCRPGSLKTVLLRLAKDGL
jgi:hypothetical protein